MKYSTGSIIRMNSLSDINIKPLCREDRIVIANIANVLKPDYLFCIKSIDECHFLCACTYSSPQKKSTKIPCANDQEFWIKDSCIFVVHSLFLSEAEIKLDIPNLVNYANRLIRKYNQKKLEAFHKEQNAIKKKERSRKLEIEKQKKQKSAIRKKQFEEKLRKTAKSDPRYYANEGVVKNDGRGKAPKYKRGWANSQYNIDHPLSAGRGNM